MPICLGSIDKLNKVYLYTVFITLGAQVWPRYRDEVSLSKQQTNLIDALEFPPFIFYRTRTVNLLALVTTTHLDITLT